MIATKTTTTRTTMKREKMITCRALRTPRAKLETNPTKKMRKSTTKSAFRTVRYRRPSTTRTWTWKRSGARWPSCKLPRMTKSSRMKSIHRRTSRPRSVSASIAGWNRSARPRGTSRKIYR
uniref:(northern house mosquito) hypothetical protein n=1 Tax=Culex pipiens TaxID=7175 RepID=A0A8D8D8C2_CULPI